MKVPKPIKQLLKAIITPEIYAGLTSKINRATTPKVKANRLCIKELKNRKGFEIGGPSPIFGRDGLLPIYKVVGSVDNCNFSASTTWEGALAEGANFRFDAAKPPGYQYIRDAVDLYGIESNSMDFVLSSHNIEHVANPIKALREWLRILKENGLLVLVVPHKEGTFDHLRPVTSLEHLITDFENKTAEDDLSHVEEIIRLHDFSRDSGVRDIEELRDRSENNFENRCLHQHVFSLKSVLALLDYLGVQISSAESVLPAHIICVVRKLSSDIKPDNEKFLSNSTECLHRSPFAFDRNLEGI